MNRIAFLLLTALLMMSGCVERTTKMTGKVTFPDGKPLVKGVVIYDNGQQVAKGVVQPDGTYSMSFGARNLDNGLPPGKYKVYIQGAINLVAEEVVDEITGQTASSTMNDQSEFLIAEAYRSRATTPLEVTVTKKPEVFDIEVDYPE